MECPVCKVDIDEFGACECVPEDDKTRYSELLSFLAFVVILLLVLAAKFIMVPHLDRARCLEMVREKESNFLRAFHKKIASDPNLELIGWECELVSPWGLVTLLYSDKPESDDRKAYFWCVQLEEGEVHRLKSLKHFVDDFLLEEKKASAP